MTNILYLNIGKPVDQNWNGMSEKSAITRKSVNKAMLFKDGFDGDGVADIKHHGGPDRAVCFYPFEHYRKWQEEFNKPFNHPSFGENISAVGMTEDQVFIGDIYRLGDSVIQVSQGRVPCSKISKNNQIDLLLKRVVETGYTGFLFRVLEEGLVYENSELHMIERKQSDVSILKANEIYFRGRKDYEAIEMLLGVKDLAEAWKSELQERLSLK